MADSLAGYSVCVWVDLWVAGLVALSVEQTVVTLADNLAGYSVSASADLWVADLVDRMAADWVGVLVV